MSRSKQRLKALHKARRVAVPVDRLDALLGNKTVAQVQAEVAQAQWAERRAAIAATEARLLECGSKTDLTASDSFTNHLSPMRHLDIPPPMYHLPPDLDPSAAPGLGERFGAGGDQGETAAGQEMAQGQGGDVLRKRLHVCSVSVAVQQ